MLVYFYFKKYDFTDVCDTLLRKFRLEEEGDYFNFLWMTQPAIFRQNFLNFIKIPLKTSIKAHLFLHHVVIVSSLLSDRLTRLDYLY